MLLRSTLGEVQGVDGHCLSARLVGYNVPSPVIDILPSGLDRYVEEIASSIFERQIGASPDTIRRIEFLDGHPPDASKLGYQLTLRNADDGLYGDMRVYNTRAEDVAMMLADGITDVSIGFAPHPKGTLVRSDGTRVRTRGTLLHVALVPQGAHVGAETLAFRSTLADMEADEAEKAETEARAAKRAELLRELAELEEQQTAMESRYST